MRKPRKKPKPIKRPHVHVIWCERGFYPHHIGFCPSERAWKNEMKQRSITDEPYPTSDAKCTFFTPKGRTSEVGPIVLVTVAEAMDKLKDKGSVIALILHEAVHVWQAIKEKINERNPGLECEAYAVQAIAQDLLYHYNKTRRKLF